VPKVRTWTDILWPWTCTRQWPHFIEGGHPAKYTKTWEGGNESQCSFGEFKSCQVVLTSVWAQFAQKSSGKKTWPNMHPAVPSPISSRWKLHNF
jgi:hypothetical protein